MRYLFVLLLCVSVSNATPIPKELVDEGTLVDFEVITHFRMYVFGTRGAYSFTMNAKYMSEKTRRLESVTLPDRITVDGKSIGIVAAEFWWKSHKTKHMHIVIRKISNKISEVECEKTKWATGE